MHDAYFSGRFRRTKITHKASDAAENLQLQCVVGFFLLPPKFVTHDTYISGRSENNIKCVVHDDLGDRIKELDIFCHVTGFTSDFLSFIVVEHILFFHGAIQLT